MVEVIQVDTWEAAVCQIKALRRQVSGKNKVWFRGQEKSCWALETTLDRRPACSRKIADYYKTLREIRPEIEAFTGVTWEVPSYVEVAKLTKDFVTFTDVLMKRPEDLSYSFLAHLRHHGFPSPLLDWSDSMYVAAYFAFAKARPGANVAIFVYSEMPDGTKNINNAEPHISAFGHRVRTHKRHFLQKSNYTICIEIVKKDAEEEWQFTPHQRLFDLQGDVRKLAPQRQDWLWKVEIPASERAKVMRYLDEFNLNAFSLFDSEDSLMETLAVREFDLRS